jgi:hypothetical protein
MTWRARASGLPASKGFTGREPRAIVPPGCQSGACDRRSIEGVTLVISAPADAPREELKRLISRYGPDLADNPSRVGGLLRDVCGQYRKEISLLVGAAQEGIPSEFRHGGTGLLTASRLGSLARKLEGNRGLSEANARWAVEAWAAALAPEQMAGEERAPSFSGADATIVGTTSLGPDVSSPSPLEGHPSFPPVVQEALETPTSISAPNQGGTDPQPWQMSAPSRPLSPPPAPGERKLRGTDRPAESAPTRGSRRRRGFLAGVIVAFLALTASAVAIPFLSEERAGPSNTPSAGSHTMSPTAPPSDVEPEPPVRGPRGVRVLNKSLNTVGLIWKLPAGRQRVRLFLVLRNGEQIGKTHKHKFTDREVQPGADYRYVILAIGADDSRAKSKPLPVTVPNPPPPPATPAPQDPPPSPSPAYNPIDTKAECDKIHGIWTPGDQHCTPP